MADYTAMKEALYGGDAETVAKLTQQALDNGDAPDQVLAEGLVRGMNVVGVDFRDGELFIPEVLMAADAMKAGMELLRPLLAEGKSTSLGTVVIGTVQGDLHDIGKNLVGMLLEGAGFDVVDVGIDVAPEKFAEAVKEHKADVIGLSALLTTSMTMMVPTMEALANAGVRDSVKVLVGGAPVTQDYATEINADGYASNAASAVDKVKEMLGIPA